MTYFAQDYLRFERDMMLAEHKMNKLEYSPLE